MIEESNKLKNSAAGNKEKGFTENQFSTTSLLNLLDVMHEDGEDTILLNIE